MKDIYYQYLKNKLLRYIFIGILFFWFLFPVICWIIKVGKVWLYTLWYTNVNLVRCDPNTYKWSVDFNISILWDWSTYKWFHNKRRSSPDCSDWDISTLWYIIVINNLVGIPTIGFWVYDRLKKRKLISNALLICWGVSLFLIVLWISILIVNHYIIMNNLPFYTL